MLQLSRNNDMILTDDLIEKCSNHRTDACEKGVKTDVMVEPYLQQRQQLSLNTKQVGVGYMNPH